MDVSIINSQEIGVELIDRLDFLMENTPLLVGYDKNVFRTLKERFKNGITSEECFFVQFLLGEIGMYGFELVNTSYINLSNSHIFHYGFRNEWWKIRGGIYDSISGKTEHIYVTIWRHSYVPADDKKIFHYKNIWNLFI